MERLTKRGITQPFEIQTLVLPDALLGRDILGKAKTGSGKTLAFALPLVQRMNPGINGTQALVLVPTRELAAQVAEEVKTLCGDKAKVVAVYGGTGMNSQMRNAPGAHILVATPGRLIDLVERKAAKLGNVHILVIDEADRMADMGFLPQVAQILSNVPKKRQTMLFSATLDDQIMGLIAQTIDPVRYETADSTPTVEGVEHHLFEVIHVDKGDVLIALLRRAPRGLTLVFTKTKASCDRLSKKLAKAGLSASPIHGDMHQGAREKSLKKFEGGDNSILVATDVAARGLDIDNVTMVVNYDPPDDHRSYLHRVGRTARAGKTGVAVTLATWQQRKDVERMAKRLNLNPHIVEMVATDDRLEQVGTGELESSQPRAAQPGGTATKMMERETYRKMAKKRRRR